MPKALVVDDSRAIRRILARTLAKLGYDVCEAGNGREALDELDRQRDQVSLVLVDWNMPEMTGIEFVRAARRDPRYTNVPLIMVTTETQVEQMVEALEAGANEYVMKPFTDDIIAGKLRMVGAIQ